MKLHHAFTIVELVVIIATIAILAGIGTVGYGGMQRNAREKERESDTAIIKMSLEEFYEKNGRYPAIDEMVGTEEATLNFLARDLNIPETALVSPLAPAGTVNSIVDGTGPGGAAPGPFLLSFQSSYGYTAQLDDGSPCQTPAHGDCTRFALFYLKEGPGEGADNDAIGEAIVELRSRYGW